jgi:hypothetical protein
MKIRTINVYIPWAILEFMTTTRELISRALLTTLWLRFLTRKKLGQSNFSLAFLYPTIKCTNRIAWRHQKFKFTNSYEIAFLTCLSVHQSSWMYEFSHSQKNNTQQGNIKKEENITHFQNVQSTLLSLIVK